MLYDKIYFDTAKQILQAYNFMTAKKLTSYVNKELGTSINAQTLTRYISIYNDGTIKKTSKKTWEYVG